MVWVPARGAELTRDAVDDAIQGARGGLHGVLVGADQEVVGLEVGQRLLALALARADHGDLRMCFVCGVWGCRGVGGVGEVPARLPACPTCRVPHAIGREGR